jgi:hypothetical protein
LVKQSNGRELYAQRGIDLANWTNIAVGGSWAYNPAMRRTAILLALVIVVLADAQTAKAEAARPLQDFTFAIARHQYGISDMDVSESTSEFGIEIETRVFFGPLGSRIVPFTATQGMVGFSLIAAGLVGLLIFAKLRRSRRSRSGKNG